MTNSEAQRRDRRPWLAIVTGTAIAGGILAAVVVPRIERTQAEKRERARQPRLVETVVVQSAPWTINLTLDGVAMPVTAMTVHAPLAGTVERVIVDIGDKVTRGQALAKVTPLTAPADDVAIASQEVVAPFDGVVTSRNSEPGAVVGPATAPLFEIADTSTLKIYIDVPQTLAPWVKVDESVAVSARAVSLAAITGTVVRTSGALDHVTHTMRIEVHIPGERLLAGSAVTVRFGVNRDVTPPMIPAKAIAFGTTWPRVVRVIDGRAHYASIELGWDRGHEIEIASGVEVGDVIIINPPPNVREGEILQVNEATAAR